MFQVQGISYFLGGSGMRFDSTLTKLTFCRNPPTTKFQLLVVALCFNLGSKKEIGCFVAQAEPEHCLL